MNIGSTCPVRNYNRGYNQLRVICKTYYNHFKERDIKVQREKHVQIEGPDAPTGGKVRYQQLPQGGAVRDQGGYLFKTQESADIFFLQRVIA